MLVRDQGAVPLTIVRPAIVESAVEKPMAGWIDAVRVADPLLVAYGRARVSALPSAQTRPGSRALSRALSRLPGWRSTRLGPRLGSTERALDHFIHRRAWASR